MEQGKDHDLEAALRRSRLEADDEFVNGLAGDIEAATRSGGPSRRRWFGVGAALATTAVLIAALGASMGGSVTYAPAAVYDAVNDTLSADNNAQADTQTPADDEYNETCNSGRGNLSETESGSHETDSDTLINPHEGGTGPGESPTDDCDPGNSGPHNSGGD